MPGAKETEEEMRNKVTEIHQSGRGYEDISRVLGIQRTTVKAVTDKSRTFETVVNENYSTTHP